MVHLERSFVQLRNFDASESRPDIVCKFGKVVLVKCGEQQLDRSCVKRKVLRTVKKQGNILHKIKRMTANWIGLIWRRSSLLKDVTEGKLEKKIRQGRKLKQLLDELQEMKSYGNLKAGELDGTP